MGKWGQNGEQQESCNEEMNCRVHGVLRANLLTIPASPPHQSLSQRSQDKNEDQKIKN
jgi:hypothetical protein